MWGSKPPWRSGEIPKALWPAQGFRDIRISFFASPTITWVTSWWHPNWECRRHENNPTISQFACPGFLLMSLYFICRYMYPVHPSTYMYILHIFLHTLSSTIEPLIPPLQGSEWGYQRTPNSSASETYVMAKRISSEPGRSASSCRVKSLHKWTNSCWFSQLEQLGFFGSTQRVTVNTSSFRLGFVLAMTTLLTVCYSDIHSYLDHLRYLRPVLEISIHCYRL